ncbi:MAG: hypothetical protein EOO13_09305 [Chitinophagaceae bacterium]|nr:MAG: hypothetical protein EOO13_09305 [Chitinophagaceae bacterium]
MKLMVSVLSFILLSVTSVSGQYGDAYHRADVEKINKERKAYTDAYIDALRYNRNTTIKNSSPNNGSAADAARQLADIFAGRAGRETAAQKAERLKRESENYELYLKKKAEDEQKYSDYRKDDEERRNSILLPMKALYKAAGFTGYETEILGYSHLHSKLTSDKQKNIYSFEFVPQSVAAKDALIEFNNRFNSASFEELFDLVSSFNIAAFTALTSLQKLEKRFPEKKAIIGASYMMHTASFWGKYNDNTYLPQYDKAEEGVKKTMLDIFRNWLKTYPEGAMMVASQAHPQYNPLKIIAAQTFENGDYDEAAQVAILALQAPLLWKDDLGKSRDAIAAFSNIFRHPKHKKLYLFTAADIKGIAENHGLPARMVIEWLTGEETDKYTTAGKWRDEYAHTFKLTYGESGYDKILKELGENGDGDALNAYAYGLAFGVSKGKPASAVALWNKAADSGSSWAMYNLLLATKWGFKWYGPKDLQAAREKLKTFKPATKFDQYVYNNKINEMRSF